MRGERIVANAGAKGLSSRGRAPYCFRDREARSAAHTSPEEKSAR